ncbi:MAG: alkaline phosphatase family protein [Myxococcales bacterium]|nr:alkaline phosphatase family protein [Myxococcales bacterium]
MCNSRAAALAFLFPLPALAYIDPGTGGLIVGGLTGLIAYGALILLALRKKLALLARLLAKAVSRHRVLSAVVTACAALAAVAFWVWERSTMSLAPPLPARYERVLAIGLDGADPRVVGRMLEEGLLPNMKRLAEQGSFRPLAIPNPAQSPVVWATLATGQNPGANGIYDFIGRDPKSYTPKLSLMTDSAGGGEYRHPIRAKAFWDVTTQQRVPAVVLRWPMTFPPREIHGRMLAGLGVPDIRGSLGRYTFFTDQPPLPDEEGRDKVTVVRPDGDVIRTELGGPRVRWLSGVKTLSVPLEIRVDRASRAARLSVGGSTVEVKEGQWSGWLELTFSAGLFTKHRGLTKVFLSSAAEPFAMLAGSVELHPDAPLVPFAHPKGYASELRAQLGLFHTLGMPEDTKAYAEGRVSEEAFLAQCREVEAERRAMLRYELSRFESGVLAVVFDSLDRIQHMTPQPEELASSAAGRYLIDFDGFLGAVLEEVKPGTAILLFSDHGFSEFEKSVDLNRWLVEAGEMAIDEEAYRSRPPGSHGELFRHVKWEKTRAYAVGFSGLYLNVKGREGAGIVSPDERAAVAAGLATRLRALADPGTGEPVVHRVYRREELYRGAHSEEAPDLVVGFRPGYRGSWQSAIGGLAEGVLAANQKRWQRDHIVDAEFVDGMLLTNFEVPSERPRASDIAPTIVSLIGLPVPEEFEGTALQRQPDRLASRERR